MGSASNKRNAKRRKVDKPDYTAMYAMKEGTPCQLASSQRQTKLPESIALFELLAKHDVLNKPEVHGVAFGISPTAQVVEPST